jgi:hypothetical protein
VLHAEWHAYVWLYSTVWPKSQGFAGVVRGPVLAGHLEYRTVFSKRQAATICLQ